MARLFCGKEPRTKLGRFVRSQRKILGMNSSETTDDFGNMIRTARLKAGLSQSELSKKLGFSKAHISAVELGKNSIGKAHLMAFANILNIDQEIIKSKKPSRKIHMPRVIKKSPLGQNVARIRVSLSLTRKTIEEKAGISSCAIYLIESGLTPHPRIITLEKLAQAFNCRVLDLI